jgi:hypothetical protein
LHIKSVNKDSAETVIARVCLNDEWMLKIWMCKDGSIDQPLLDVAEGMFLRIGPHERCAQMSELEQSSAKLSEAMNELSIVAAHA